eukprot:TRINITY_DN708_c0_g1_i9.p1 TRINITY_DN708_c0_g1~~TRINITY_DN708_c0_g1_i9.p1  ORF type:complete len:238 (-),score=72.85 TRINITY_DN708_c0_g1_i9:1054-1767(-)
MSRGSSGINAEYDFTVPGVVGNNVCELLNQSFSRFGMTIHVDALISDTVGTLLTGTYQTKEGYCFAGLILGTGSNVCYWEKMGNIHKIPGGDCEGGCAEEKMVINVESGNFGSRSDFDGVFPMNEFDKELDQHSPNSGEQLLEKQISGMYLGEMWRLVVKKYVDQGLIFASYLAPLTEPFSIPSSLLSQIEGDESAELVEVDAGLRGIGILTSLLEERRLVKNICHVEAVVSTQSTG